MRVDFFVAGQKTLIHYPTVHPFLTGSGRQFFNASSCLSRFMVIAICHFYHKNAHRFCHFFRFTEPLCNNISRLVFVRWIRGKEG